MTSSCQNSRIYAQRFRLNEKFTDDARQTVASIKAYPEHNTLKDLCTLCDLKTLGIAHKTRISF